MTEQRPRVFVYRGTVPWWLLLAVAAPLGLVFLTSLVLAVAVIGVVATLAAFVVPLFLRRPDRRDDRRTIELDPSQYHHIESHPRRDDR